ncbi:uncharacterized protein B0I36DRAFT_288346 [Microdochium trichocladiopsis]|uniref:Carrier domain-containing protein n=1 Tax=Microdochium trichocladiopsis TaxID=1682393 RepID=A0A9P8Y6B7_9PEZI|nr:uncharacterized protein B0I36DRAFT_288346 [Microdochium trichocladiopsis]KAH7030733.1 hypothetical protein B0I36DRAFT_288346 [Microdochium trichocladiopsis]
MADPEPIAIIGMGCRLPGGVSSPEELWTLVETKGSGWKLVPSERWNRDAFYHPDGAAIQAYNTKSGYFLTHDVSDFDSRFFGFGAHEADATDPQQRILLETTYEALENAGIPIESLKGSDTAVFAAVFARDYDRMGYKNLETFSKFNIGGTGEAIIANRLSHFFDLRGVSMTIDTGCSGSLVALHEACISLRARQSNLAIVGGTEVILHPDQNVAMSSGGMINSEGKCFAFDSRGAGYGRGEGVATVIVKRLADAIRDGDTVHAVIRNSGANQDGKTNGITLPNPEAQEALIRSVYKAAGLDPLETLYVEAHGTGTEVGDQAEIQSLGNVFGEKPRSRNLYVGSVKTNIGHLEAASGVAGLLKAIMVLKKQKIPPNLNFIKPKPGLRLEERQISVPLETTPLVPEHYNGPVRVSLNSFGYGGTNCHIILETLDQYVSSEKKVATNGHITNGSDGDETSKGQTNGQTNGLHHRHTNGHTNGHDTGSNGSNGANGAAVTDSAIDANQEVQDSLPLLFPLSANSEASLSAMPGILLEWLAAREVSESDLKDLSHTLSSRRSLFRWRKSFVAQDLKQLRSALSEPKISKTRASNSARIAFVFTGQGAQWAGMGRELAVSSKVFRRSLDQASEILKSLGCQWDLLEELSKTNSDSRINESEVAQPATTILQMALVDVLADFGISPQFVVGHSSGEIAAAYAGGALSQEDSVRVSYFRGRCSATAKKLNSLAGSMLATGYSEQAALQTLKAANLNDEKGRVVVACVNSPSSTTLSGDEPAIDYINSILTAAGVFSRKLKVETAYHSHHMEKVADSYIQTLGDLAGSDVRSGVEFLSSVTGQAKTSDFGPEYWVKNLVSKVRFHDALEAVAQRMGELGSRDVANIFIEIGPHAALQGPANQTLSAIPGFKSSYLSPISRGKNSSDTLSVLLGRIFELGGRIKLSRPLDGEPRHVVGDLAPYPWDHIKHWAESRLSRGHRLRQFPYHDLLGLYDVMSPIEEPRWRQHLSVQRHPWLKDHIVDGMIIFPGAGYSAMCIEAMKQLTQMQNADAKIVSTAMKDMQIVRPIIMPTESTGGLVEDVEVQLILSPSKTSDAWYTARVLSLQADQTWAEHVSAWIRVELESPLKPGAVESFGTEHTASIEEAFEALERIQSLAQERLPSESFYDERRKAGNDWGPSFALLTEAYIGPGIGFSKMNIPDIAQWMPAGYFQPHLIHPTTLDASNHMLPAIFHREISNAPIMPVSTEETIFSSLISSRPGDEMIVAMELKPQGRTAGLGNIWAFQKHPETGELRLVIIVRGLLLRAVGEDASKASSQVFKRKHNYQISYLEDPDFLTEPGFKQLLNQYFRLMTNKNPRMNVLEIGAGTGSATLPLFQALGDDARDLINHYCYTDISSGFFEPAKDRLDKWKSVIEYKTLDISKDPLKQDFSPQQYDVVVASNVLHATRSMKETMTNVRKLLKPGGTLLLAEANRITTTASHTPLLANDEWHELLLSTSFGGIEFSSPDCDGPLARTSFIVSKAVEESRDETFPAPTSVQIVTNPASAISKTAADSLSTTYQEQGLSSASTTWELLPEVKEDADTLYVVLDSANSAILAKPDPGTFHRIQNLVANCRNILWISFQESDGADLAPAKALVNGLARVMRRENEGIKFITVEVRDLVTEEVVVDMVKETVRISQLLLSKEKEHVTTDDEEFVLSGGKILIPRVYADKKFNDWTDRLNGHSLLTPTTFQDPTLPLRMEVGAPGLLNSIHFVKDEIPSQALGEEEIQIDSAAFGVNFRDVFNALGQLHQSTFIGEVSGVVTAMGSGEFVQSTYKVGDRVVGMLAQPFASYSRLRGYEAHVIPDSLSFAEAASVHVIFTTVYYSLVTLARLEAGQTVLIHSGSGGVGQAAIQLAQHLGATVYVTVGSEEKRQFLIKEYGVPASNILSSRANPRDLKSKVMRLTGGRGVDVVLNSTSGEMLSASWECVASLGYHIELGKSDIDKNRHISMAPFKRNVTFASVDLVVIASERPKVLYKALHEALALFEAGVLKPVRPLNVFPADRLEAAFRLIAERKHMGKVVIDFKKDTMVQAVLPPPPQLQLKRNGTYIIAGGLGDIGRTLFSHLSKLGAGHIITLSRRAIGEEERSGFEKEAAKFGAKLHILQCDITDVQSVKNVAKYCQDSLPPVRGLIHAGMVLQDRPMTLMTDSEWNTVLAPKTVGTINLDNVFASPELEFFIILASMSGILGNPGQANYSAANAFQDSFVTSRNKSNGTRYASFDLPLVNDTAANSSLKSESRDSVVRGSIIFNFDELLQLVDYTMDASTDIGKPFFHSLMGFDRQSMNNISANYVWGAQFRTIPQMQEAGSNEFGNTSLKKDVEALLRNVTSVDEAVNIITETTVEKFVAFLNLDAEDVSADEPLSTFGLDSLVSIELKNWMVRTFKVSLQASELTSAPSIVHLAKRLASRSKLLPADLAQSPEAPKHNHEPAETNGHFQDKPAAREDASTSIPDFDCCAVPGKEALQPVPDLLETMKDHMESIAHFATNESEVDDLRAAIAEFTAPNGIAAQIHKQIQNDARDPAVGNWVSKFLAEDYHLRMRQAVQYTNFMAINHASPVPHTQAERAALLAVTAYQLKLDIDDGSVATPFIMDTSVCRLPLQRLFNTYRQPQVVRDELKKGSGTHCVVLRRGRLFKVPLQDGDKPASLEAVKSTFDSILELVNDDGTWAGILTTDNRDSWAMKRTDLLAIDPANATYFQTIEDAAFTVNLDDGEASLYGDWAKKSKLGDGFNRWNDKALQLVVTAEGNSGVLVEHSYLDGTTPAPLYDRLRDAIAAHRPDSATNGHTNGHSHQLAFEELSLALSPEIESHISSLRTRWLEFGALREFISYPLPTISSSLLGQSKIPTKGGYDVLCQLALYFYFGHVTPSWQPVMLSHFHQGRHDIVQITSPPVRAFCEAAGDESIPATKRRDLLLEAAKDVTRRIRDGKDGKGFCRLYSVIQMQWPEDQPKAALFDDALFRRAYDFTSVTNPNHNTVEGITTPLDPSALRLRYTIRDNDSWISFNCPTGQAEKLRKCVDQAATIIRTLALAD